MGGLEITTIGIRLEGDQVVGTAQRVGDAFDTLGTKTSRLEEQISKANRRLGGSELQSSLAAERKLFADRIAAIQNNLQREMRELEAVRQARLRSSMTSAEVTGIQDAYRAQAEAAKQSAREQIEAARSVTIANQRALGNTATALEDVTTKAARTGLTMNSMRSSLTSLATSLLGLNPHLTTLTSQLGVMSAGTVWTIGIVAGITAIGYAWSRVTGDAKKLRDEADELAKSLERAAEARRFGELDGPAQQLGAGLGYQEQARRDYERSKITERFVNGPGGEISLGIDQQAVGRAKALWEDWTKHVAELQAQISDIKKRNALEEQAATDREAARRKAGEEHLTAKRMQEAEDQLRARQRQLRKELEAEEAFTQALLDEWDRRRAAGEYRRLNTAAAVPAGMSTIGTGRTVLDTSRIPREMSQPNGGIGSSILGWPRQPVQPNADTLDGGWRPAFRRDQHDHWRCGRLRRRSLRFQRQSEGGGSQTP